MAISVDQILVLGDHVLCLVNSECQVWHSVILFNCALGTPETHRVQLWLTGSISVVHDAQQIVHRLLWERNEGSARVWQHDSRVELEGLISEFDTCPVQVPRLLWCKSVMPLDWTFCILCKVVATDHELRG